MRRSQSLLGEPALSFGYPAGSAGLHGFHWRAHCERRRAGGEGTAAHPARARRLPHGREDS